MISFNADAETYRKLINESLFKAVNSIGSDGAVKECMKYSLEAGGKRIRPMLLLEFFRTCSTNSDNSEICFKKALPSALAIEMIHTFSLIHDDLPCMDDDDLRRGKPSCHKKFSEWSALLAGDAFPFYALELITNSVDGEDNSDIRNRLRAVNEICRLSGVTGMIRGQQLDMEYENSVFSDKLEDKLILMYSLKTSALLKAACRTGVILAGGDNKAVKNAGVYAEKLGLAFQITDDILDMTGDEKTLGKPVGSDKAQNKTTYASVFGMEKAHRKAQTLTNEAIKCLEEVPDNGFLIKLTNELLKRNC